MKFIETTYLESTATIDGEAGVIRGVKLLGLNSRNGRRYTNEAAERATPLYEGAKIYVNHPRRNDVGEDRPFSDWAGVIRNPVSRSDGIYGDAELRKESTYFRGIIEAAQRFPKSIGFSHVAEGDSRMSGDTEIVESIKEVFSVDLVTDPATTKGFFESMQTKITLRQAVEKLPTGSPFRSQLIEGMEGGLFDGDMPLSADNDSKTNDPLTLIYNALTKVLDALVKVTGQKDMENATQSQPTPPATDKSKQPENKPTPPPVPPAVGDNTDPTKQQYESRIASLEKKLALADAKTVLTESGIEATEIRVATYINTPVEHRKALVESWPKQTAANATESTNDFWPTLSPPANNSSTSGATSDPDYEKKFWESAQRAADKLKN